MSKRLTALQVLATAAILSSSAVGYAHIKLTTPTPRSEADGLKPPTFPPPCGNVPAGAIKAVYKPGATVNVKWVETIGHAGCFQIGFSSDGTNFTVLKQIDDPAGQVGNGLAFNTDVTLPAGVKCDKCTLQLRQLMLENAPVKTCVANQVPPAGGANGNTYYSCSDVKVSDDPDASIPPDPDAGGDGGSSGSSGTSGTSGTSGGPGEPDDDAGPSSSGNNGAPSAPRPTKKSDDGGCTMTPGDATTGAFGVGMAALFGLAMVRRRRNK